MTKEIIIDCNSIKIERFIEGSEMAKFDVDNVSKKRYNKDIKKIAPSTLALANLSSK